MPREPRYPGQKPPYEVVDDGKRLPPNRGAPPDADGADDAVREDDEPDAPADPQEDER